MQDFADVAERRAIATFEDRKDPLLGTRSVPALTANASNSGSVSVTLPQGLAPGSYGFFAKADGPGTITETNEFNNTRMAFIRIGPDLLVTALTAPAIPPKNGFYDEVMDDEVQFSLGFMKPGLSIEFGSPGSFGAPGAGGSLGFADPEHQIGYGYIPNRKGVTLTGDPRDVALREALYASAPVAAAVKRVRTIPVL